MQTCGVYDLAVTGATTAGVILYYVVADGSLTATVGSNKRFGYALAAQSRNRHNCCENWILALLEIAAPSAGVDLFPMR